MNVLIVSIDHYLQLLEADTDSETLRASKLDLRELLRFRLSKGNVAMIFEESAPAKSTIAAQLASQNQPAIPWRNIIMTEGERRAAGIFEALRNRPGHPNWDDMEYWIEHRIPEDEIRENFFADQISKASYPGDVLVLLGDMHVRPVADRLRAMGHDVELRPELVPVKRWQ
jgi:hypothetical protein